jgi:hypothetical protein
MERKHGVERGEGKLSIYMLRRFGRKIGKKIKYGYVIY